MLAKKTYSVTIDETISEDFKSLCKDNGVNQSMLIEAFMRSYVNEHVRLELVNNEPEVKIK